ncbi:imelysin family protein [Thalassovita sp.]|jgi:predicted lipoprotein|uniref:imelysin family protein n=1 Tax=Thalassovita sp. TaxID=1979401 RepID=UPI003B59DFD7
MLKPLLLAAIVLVPLPALAQTPVSKTAVDAHILPGFTALEDASRRMAEAAKADCAPDSEQLRRAWGLAFDHWIRVSHLRFGPTESDNRAFALAYWPDSRGKTPKALAQMIATTDPIITTPGGVASLSIAARGYYALEFLLYDPAFRADPTYGCALIRALTADIAATSHSIAQDWRGSYGALMKAPGQDYSPYRSTEEVHQELFKALSAGLEFTSDTRLGRPLGTFDRPRPNRAEARRSGRSLRHVVLSLTALRDLALILSAGDDSLSADIANAFDAVITQATALEDPVFAGVNDPSGRLQIEILKQDIDLIREQQLANIGAKLGVAAGFNALDGD